jgi:hypothetical protein
MEQVGKHQSQGGFRRAKRLALITGIASQAFSGWGLYYNPLTGGKLREYTGRSAASPLAVLPQSPGVREPPLLPQSPGVYEQPKRVQWVQSTLSYQLPTGTPLTVSLPQLQRTSEDLPVTVTLNVSDSTPTWLTFDPDKLVLSGTAPRQDIGKTYHLTFRAQTTDGLESLLQLVVTLREQTRY